MSFDDDAPHLARQLMPPDRAEVHSSRGSILRHADSGAPLHASSLPPDANEAFTSFRPPNGVLSKSGARS
jgi:hypothetical protein